MNLSFILLLALFGAASSQRLSQAENNYLQSICGTQPANLKRSLKDSPKSNSTRRNIYNGIPVDASRAPWSVRVGFAGNKCTGTIISPRHVLTARHCLEVNPSKSWILQGARYHADSTNQVYSGTFSSLSVILSSGARASGSIVTMYLIDSMYKQPYEADLLILELNTDIPLTSTSYPVCVPKNIQNTLANSRVAIFAYGSNTYVFSGQGIGVLRYGAMTISNIFDNGRNFRVYDNRFAARPGDSGGGYLQKWNGRIHVIGVASNADETSAQGPLVGYHYNDICRLTGIC